MARHRGTLGQKFALRVYHRSSHGKQVPLTGLQAKHGVVMGVGDKAGGSEGTRRGSSSMFQLKRESLGLALMLLLLGAGYQVLLAWDMCLCVCPRAGMPCSASAPASTLSFKPLLMTSSRSCPTWGPLRSPQRGKRMSSVGRRTPSAAGPCTFSRSIPSQSCLTAGT